MSESKRLVKRGKPIFVESSGVHVRLFRRGGRYWLDVRHGDIRKRVSAKTSERSVAEANAKCLADAIATEQLLGVTADTVTLAELFAAYQHNHGGMIEGQYQTAIQTHQRHFLAAWGASTPVASISQTSVERYCTSRRNAYAAKRTTEKDETPRDILHDGALDADFRWLSSVFNWGTRHKLATGKRLLSINPLHDCKWPRERNPRRPVASHDRYLRTIEHVATIDPRGRLRAVLALARYTGRRESAIIALRTPDVLLSMERLSVALAEAGMDEGLASQMPHGAIRWTAAMDKMGFLYISPISAEARVELERYLAANPRVGDLPLFPSVQNEARSLSRSTATKWLGRAERLARLPKLARGVWHPYRRLFATERQNLSDVSVAAAGGWKSTKTLKIYQQIDPALVLAAVVNQG